MNVFLGGTPLQIGDPPQESDHVVSGRIVVDNDAVQIDAHDSEHVIRVKHTTSDGVDIFHASDRNTGATTAKINSDGEAFVKDLDFKHNGNYTAKYV